MKIEELCDELIEYAESNSPFSGFRYYCKAHGSAKQLAEKLLIAIEALRKYATPKDVIHTVYPKCFCNACFAKEALEEIERVE